MTRWYVDGAGWNGRVSRYCVVKDKEVFERKTFSKEYTNNEMEYMAMIAALKAASPGDEICADSQLIIRQIKGQYKVKKPHLVPLNRQACELVSKGVTLIEIPREENRAGKWLEWSSSDA